MLKRYTMNQAINDKEIINRSSIRKWMILVILLQAVISAIFPISAVQAEDADRCLNGLCLGTGTITNPDVPSNRLSVWSGSFVYYGKYDGTNPTKYRVLDSASNRFGVTGGSLFLDCDSILYKAAFDADRIPNEEGHLENEWAISDLKAALNGGDFLDKDGNFTEVEKNAIANSTMASGLNGEKIFVLEQGDVLNPDYGYGNHPDSQYYGAYYRKKSEKYGYWLRTASGPSYYVWTVTSNYSFGENLVDNAYHTNSGVSPVFNVSLSSILFSSEISSESKHYKLTLKDDGLNIAVTSGKNVYRKGDTVTVPYTISGTSAVTTETNPTKAYVMVTDKEYTAGDAAILQYSELTAGTESGTGTFTLDSSITGTWGTGYHVYLLAVNENGEKETDYAGEPVELSEPYQPLTYKANGGTGDDVTEFYVNGSGATVKDVTDQALFFTREGYLFTGWNTVDVPAETTPGISYAAGDTITMNADVTLFAQWAEPVASITRGSDESAVTTYYASLHRALGAADNGDLVKLLKNIGTATEGSTSLIYNRDGVSVTLDLNGKTIDLSGIGQGKDTGLAFIINAGELTLKDDSTNGMITGGNGVMVLSGTFNMTNGTITGCTAGVSLPKSTLSGDTISEGESSGTFNLSGGSITGNQISGVNYVSGTFNLSGAPTISGDGSIGINIGEGKAINITGPLTNTTPIGVKLESRYGVFTSGLDGKGTSPKGSTANFNNVVEGYTIGLNDAGEAILGYTVTVGTIQHGSVTAVPARTPMVFLPGTDTIILTLAPEIGYQKDSLTASYNDGTQDKTAPVTQDTTDTSKYTFTMPAGNVTVNAVFEKVNYTITLPDPFPASGDPQCTVSAAVNGTAKTAPVTAHMGDTVQLTITCAGGFQLVDDTLTVMPVNISDQISLENNSFEMPADDVMANAWFMKLPAPIDALTYNGKEQSLITAGEANTEVSMEYVIGDASTAPDDTAAWSTTIPQGKDAGTHYVWYRLTNDLVFQPVLVTIERKEVTVSVADAADVPYDGKEHTGITDYTFTGVLTDPVHTATITYTPAKGTAVGSYTGSYGDDFKVIAGDEDVTANYELISKTAGSLNIIENVHQNEMHFFRLGRELPKTGFSALHPSPLARMPQNISYKGTAWTLQIPALDVKAEIKVVPFTDGEYPVDWLGTDVGMLEGSAHPGEGWMVITGHNHLNTMEEGPFALLSYLAVGDKIFVSGKDSSIKTFTVYASEKIDADDGAALERIAKMYENTLTLLTCEDERPEGGYASRRVTAAY